MRPRRGSRRRSALALGGCSLFGRGGKDRDEEAEIDPPDLLYNQALANLNAGDTQRGAAKKFEEIDKEHPYSDYARGAR